MASEPLNASSLSRTAIRKMKVADLRDALMKRGLETAGLRNDLVTRLLDAEEETTPSTLQNKRQQQPASSSFQLDPKKTYVLRISAQTNTSYGVAGAGLVLYDLQTEKEVWAGRKYLQEEQTKFEAEYQGLIAGLRYLKYQHGLDNVILQTDNDVLLRQISGEFQVKKDKLLKLYWATINLKESFSQLDTNRISAIENSKAKNLARRALATKQDYGLEMDTESFGHEDKDDSIEKSSSNKRQSPKGDTGVHTELPIDPGKTYLLRFDGGSRGNPGTAGAGMVLYDTATDQEVWCGWKYLTEKASNNEAEYMGLLVGLQCAKSLGIRNLLVEGDSELVVRQLAGRYQVKDSGLKVLWQQCKKEMEEFDFVKVDHILRKENGRADELANSAMDSRESWGFVDETSPTILPLSRDTNLVNADANPIVERAANSADMEESTATEMERNSLQPHRSYLLRFDGASKGNPGKAGAGVVLYDAETKQEVWYGYKFLDSPASNNESEYTALLVGLQCARSLGVTDLLVEGDSQLVIRQITGRYRVKEPRLKVLYDACKDELEGLQSASFSHIPRAENSRADELANSAIKLKQSYGFEES